jgi:DNA modification methylase
MSVKIINADVLDGLKSLGDESVHCVVTSPPYWGLRDYGHEGQIGLEKTPQEFVARMVEVFREVRRVLRKDGVCFVNLGDSYAGASANGGQHDFSSSTLKKDGRHEASRVATLAKSKEASRPQPAVKRETQCKPKDLIGIPWRVALALQDDGWWLRQDIIWHKPNPMPESVTDRCTKAHEYIFLLTKSERYWWDQEAIKEVGSGRTPGNVNYKYDGLAGHETKAGILKQSQIPQMDRNKRSVWTIATAPFSEAHFATFPPELPEICIKAGCPKGGTVLDPFGGAGTTGLVADRLQRNAVLIELNPEYAAMARRRIDGDRGGLLDVMEAAE